MDMMISIRPHQGVAPIQFGMTRLEVEKAIGATPNRIRRNEYALEEDMFPNLGISVSYDENDCVNAVSLSRGFDIELLYDGFLLFGHSARAAREWALQRDPTLDPKDGFVSKSLGLGMWADWI